MTIGSRHDTGHMSKIKLATDRRLIHLLNLSSAFGHFLVRMTILFKCGDTVQDFWTSELGQEKAGVDTADVHHGRVESLWSKG